MTVRTKALRLVGATMVGLAVVPWLYASPAMAGKSGAGSAENHKVTICHRTNANTNPYVVITVDTDAAGGGKDNGVGDHSAEHLGPVWNPSLKAAHIEWGDIIPPYTDDQGKSFPGLNWTSAGQAIYENDCKPVTPPPTSPPETTTPPETTSPPETTTPPETSPAGVLPTSAAASPQAAVLGVKAGALAASGPGIPLQLALLMSLGLLLMGAALLVLPGRPAAERVRRRH